MPVPKLTLSHTRRMNLAVSFIYPLMALAIQLYPMSKSQTPFRSLYSIVVFLRDQMRDSILKVTVTSSTLGYSYAYEITGGSSSSHSSLFNMPFGWC